MNIEIEDYNLDAAFLTCDFFVDGVYHAEQYPLEDFEMFVVANHMMEWVQHYQRMNGEWEEREGVHTFETWAKEYATTDDIKKYISHKLANG